ncbi:MAG: thermonuclease family protein [Candidatus Peribacteraceae bacterium]|nr:thermonuclease family protein [Candidatus Peribacteraceae bacterium]
MMTTIKKFTLVLGGFLLGVAVMLLLVPEFSFLEKTLDTPSQILGKSASSSSTEKALTKAAFLVTKIVDGDTIDVRDSSGRIERVRLVGIDTPETVDPKKNVQCFGPEASAFLKETLLGESVALVAKPDEDRDDYDRLLRYVFLGDEDVGSTMLAKGYAVSLCKSFPHPKCEEYDQLEEKAMSEKLGRWGECARRR